MVNGKQVTDLVRSVLNVNELYASLRNKFGAESLQVANFNRNVTMLEQIGLIRRTNILIGVHGAGMTHMIWMPPFKSSILEIYPVMTERRIRTRACTRHIPLNGVCLP